jgi:DNA primase small subunit
MARTQQDFAYLKKMFNTYYTHDNHRRFLRHLYIDTTESREFGIIPWIWDFKGFDRHLAFENTEELLAYIQKPEHIPRHLYLSAAYYEYPQGVPMRNKEYQKANLIFDLDIDHIDTPCKEEHDKWICKQCGKGGHGIPPPIHLCGSRVFTKITWECDICMEIAKSQILLLIEEFLLRDFGLSPDEVYVVFSGRRGYHIHVENDDLDITNDKARREIVDFISGESLNAPIRAISIQGARKPNKNDPAWRGRIVRLTLKYLKEASDIDLQNILRLRYNVDVARKEIITMLNSPNPDWLYQGIGTRIWQDLITASIERYTPQIDKPITIDTHRLIRLPGSLHGGTGLLVKKLSYKELQEFDPYTHTTVFTGERTVYVYDSPEFRIGNQTFGPFKNQAVELPMNAAIFLLSRRAASLVKK